MRVPRGEVAAVTAMTLEVPPLWIPTLALATTELSETQFDDWEADPPMQDWSLCEEAPRPYPFTCKEEKDKQPLTEMRRRFFVP